MKEQQAQYTDSSLKQALAKMLPENYAVQWHEERQCYVKIMSNGEHPDDWFEVLDTELLHLCWLVEEVLKPFDDVKYKEKLRELLHCGEYLSFNVLHATWQQRTLALAKVKGVDIV